MVTSAGKFFRREFSYNICEIPTKRKKMKKKINHIRIVLIQTERGKSDNSSVDNKGKENKCVHYS